MSGGSRSIKQIAWPRRPRHRPCEPWLPRYGQHFARRAIVVDDQYQPGQHRLQLPVQFGHEL
jgi:hypothetical protein